MSHDLQHSRTQLLQFQVPRLPGITLALALHEVLEVTDMLETTSVPFAPPFVIGFGEWQSHIITVLDMAEILCADAPAPEFQTSHRRFLVAQVALETQCDVVAWPVRMEMNTLTVPPQVPIAELPPQIPATMAHAAFALDGQPVVFLDLEGNLRQRFNLVSPT